LLKSGIDAHADEFARAVHEGALAASTTLTEETARALANYPRTGEDVPVVVDPQLRDAVRASADAARRAQDATASVVHTAKQHASAGGAWAAQQGTSEDSQIPTGAGSGSSQTLFSSSNKQTIRAAASTYTTTTIALTNSVDVLATAAGNAISASVSHFYGEDARALADDALTGARGAAGAVGDVGKLTSIGWWAGRGVRGAFAEGDPERAQGVEQEAREMERKVEVEEAAAVRA
jgi:hypothetical protein